MGIIEIPLSVQVFMGLLGAAIIIPMLLASINAGRNDRVAPDHDAAFPSTWHITPAAAEHWRRMQRWPDDEEHRNRAFEELEALLERVNYRETDILGRQLWRVERPENIQVTVGRDQNGPDTRRVVWVGRGRPPPWAWTRLS